MKSKTVSRKVTWDDTDRLVGILARMGLHSAAIAQRTGLTLSQVSYRIYRGDFKGARRSYRDGDSPEFNWALKSIRDRADAEVYEHIKAQIKRFKRSI